MSAISELHFARLRVEAEEALLRELSAIDAESDAMRALVLEQQRQDEHRVVELLGGMRQAQAELDQARAAVPAGLGRPAVWSSLFLGALGCAGAALACLRLFDVGSLDSDLTRAFAGVHASLQGTIAATPAARFALTAVAGALALLVGLRSMLRPRYWLVRRVRPAWFGGSAVALAGVAHWPALGAAVPQPLVEGAAFAAAAMGAWAFLKHVLWPAGVNRAWLGPTALAALLALWYFSPSAAGACLLTVVGGLCVQRANRGWHGLELLDEAARRQRRHAACRERYQRAAGLREARERWNRIERMTLFSRPNSKPPSPPERLAEIERQRQQRRLAAFEKKTAAWRELDWAQLLYGRIHGQ